MNCRWLLNSTLIVTLILPFGRAEDHDKDAQIGRLCQRMSGSVVRVISGDDRASGVVVSRTGLILTAAHAVKKDAATVRVLFSKGVEEKAKVLGYDNAADAAILQVERLPPGTDVPVVGDSTKVLIGDFVLGFGRPAREGDDAGTVVRIGNVIAKQGRLLRSSATLTVGDSGGPLFDSAGRLIALHRQIGAGRLVNIHTPIDVVLDALKESAPRFEPTADPKLEAELRLSDVFSAKPLADVRFSVVGQDGMHVPATYVGNGAVVSKLSSVGPATISEVQVSSGNAVRVQSRHNIRHLDIVVFRVVVPNDIQPANHVEASRFQFVTSPVLDGPKVGIVSRVGWDEAPRKKKLGCRLSESEDGEIRITSVSTGGAVVAAGFRAGDHIQSLNGTVCHSLNDFRNILRPLQPGDWVEISGSRSGSGTSGFGQLSHDSSTLLYRAEFLDGRGGALSERRTGFANVMQHDLPLTPNQMGSPLLDRQGRLLGVNIARRSREAVLAIPLPTILEAIKNITTVE